MQVLAGFYNKPLESFLQEVLGSWAGGQRDDCWLNSLTPWLQLCRTRRNLRLLAVTRKLELEMGHLGCIYVWLWLFKLNGV